MTMDYTCTQLSLEMHQKSFDSRTKHRTFFRSLHFVDETWHLISSEQFGLRRPICGLTF